jgi:hypothetical protein
MRPWSMKRRYTVLFFVALSPLIGLSWFAAQYNTSIWMFRSLGIYGLIVAAIAGLYALVRHSTSKGPAIVAAVASALMTLQTLPHIAAYLRVALDLGWPLLIAILGTPATFATALAISVLPLPAPPKDPQVAPARVVD